MGIFQKKQDYFALSFSDHRLQFAQTDKKRRLRRHLEKRLQTGIIERGRIKDQKRLQQAVVELIQAAKIKQRFVVVGLPEVRAFTRVFYLPPLSLEELDDAARWESESLLPFPLAKAYLDWMILEKTKDWVRILVVALPQELVEDYAKLLEDLGFQPVAFEITSLSLARLVEKNKTATLIIEVKEKEAVSVIVGARGGIEVSSTIFFKNEQEAAGEISSTISKLLNFYRKKVEGGDKKKIAKILFCGGGSKTTLIKRIGKETGIPSTPLAVKQINLASLISLAQKDVAAPIDSKTINLIPPRIQGIYDKTAQVRETSGWLKVGLFCLFLVFFAYSVAAAHVYFEIKRIEGKTIELLAAITPETKKIEERAKFYNNRAQKIIALSDSRSEIVSQLSLIQQLTPEGVVVTHYFFDGDKKEIFVNGTASRRGELLSFREALEKTEKFLKVHIPLSSLERETDVQFTLSITSKKES